MHRTHLHNAVIAGMKVFLRPPLRKDLSEFVALNRASTRLHRGLVSPPTRPEEFTSFLKRSRRLDSVCLLVCKGDSVIIGCTDLSQIFRGGFQSAYLGYYVGAPYARQGFMTEALQLMLRYAFRHLKLHRLEANIQPVNVASLALVKRAGFVQEGFSRRYLKICGQWRDHERWAILAEDWKATQAG
ncbi:MAG TPA: GNAT family protein [Pyrinomonadaceae bacterium]|nr:GNAT family protein [Pyrinomonadaceae bacterium]